MAGNRRQNRVSHGDLMPLSPAKRSNTKGGGIRICILFGVLFTILIAAAAFSAVWLFWDKGNDRAPQTTVSPEQTTPGITPTIIGVWDAWSDWSACDLTCGGGRQVRIRACKNEPCIGVDEQETFCNERPCPLPPVGVWQGWGAWGECSTTCGGGTKTRVRTCELLDGDMACVGNSSQAEDCNDFECPDCTRVCDEGVLMNCSYCACVSTTYSGQVLAAKSRLPLPGVEVTPLNNPSLVLHTTSADGRYTFDGPCGGTTLRLRKTGYLEAQYNAESTSGTITMTKAEPLEVEMSPVSKKRLVGEDVTFCCHVTGEPPPNNYEWFKDDQIIQTDESGDMISNLTIFEVDLTDSGTYKCRANNDFSARYSSSAVLTVKETEDDFCLSTPLTSYLPLPAACLLNNESVIDVGKCRQMPCRSSNATDMGQCETGDNFCCGPTEYINVIVDCDSFPTYDVITQCGCKECLEAVRYLTGKVIRSRSSVPVPDAMVFYNDSEIAVTDEKGKFNMTIASGVDRITISVDPPSGTNLTDTTQTLIVSQSSSGLFSMTIKLMERAPAIVVNASEDIVAVMNTTDNGTSVADIMIPARSFYDENGDLFEGDVSISVTAVQPIDQETSETVPGDFSAVGSEGDEERLNSAGMFKIDVEGNGNKLQAPGEIFIDVPIETTGTETDENGNSMVKLWTMSAKTGRWVFESDLEPVADTFSSRHKRSHRYRTTIRGLPVTKTWYNFDAVSSTTCYSKVWVYESDFMNQVSGAAVSVVEVSSSGNSLSTVRAYTDRGDGNGYCIAHRCDNEFRSSQYYGFSGRIIVDVFGKETSPIPFEQLSWQDIALDRQYEVIDGSISVDLRLKASDTNGPFYNWGNRKWRYSDDCSYAPDNDYSFDFVLPFECEVTNPQPGLKENYDGRYYYEKYVCYWYRHSFRYLLMYPFHAYHQQSITSCYLKVNVNIPTLNSTKFMAKSEVGNAYRYRYVEPGQLYGNTENCVKNSVSCLEVKVPGDISCSVWSWDYMRIEDGFTRVTVTPPSRDTPYRVTLNHRLTGHSASNVHFGNSGNIAFDFRPEMEDDDWGIFCATAPNIPGARATAKDACFASDKDQWAVKYSVRSPDDISSSTSSIPTTTTTTTTSVIDATNEDDSDTSGDMATSDVAFTFNNDQILTTLNDDSPSAVTDGSQTIPIGQDDSTLAYPETSTLVGESDQTIAHITAEDQGFSLEDEGITVDSPEVTEVANDVSVQIENNQVLTTEWGEEVIVR